METDASLVESLTITFENKFRHLPVTQNRQVAGALSCRDIPVDYWIMWKNWVTAQTEPKSAPDY